MALTADVKHELARIRAPRPQTRAAEASAMLRFSGGLHVIHGRVAVECELDTADAARKLGMTLLELYGVKAEIAVISGSGPKSSRSYLVRVVTGGEVLARQTGLIDNRHRPVRGLPNRLTTGSIDDLAGVWRGAFLVQGSLTDPGRSSSLEVICPTSEAGMALVGAASRLGIQSKAREVRGQHRVMIRDSDDIAQMLEVMGAGQSVEAWTQMRQRREVRANANRLVNFDDANLRRSAQAAVAACARVERAFEILGEDIPDHLVYAGRLRLEHREASLDELGRLADPQLTKDAVAGRIRRLLAMADKQASDSGLPGTDAAITDDMED
ncbi:DNA-binding protein WhiA [uncultured Agrococcus sp.]|uniref:DNA-binding protein WhiA n=1 Tax=uncultured Agrococcus sp. TaxID=382258 RepID=UPI0025CD6042|nr:DNA-binding protein WhiA [uncultured Agrococcus sp.]